MKKFSPSRRIAGVFLLLIFVASGLTRPFSAQQPGAADRKLPPVNWVRSRNIDVKHLDVDLRFDWDKEQAIGSEVITLAPFADADHVQLDAAMMTINSVSLVGGGPLQFNYDAKADNNNLDIALGRIMPGGQDLQIKIDYATNYVNKAEGDTAIGGFGRGLRFIRPTALEPNKPRQIWSQGESEFNRYWFPSYDSPNDFRTQDLRATVQKPFFVVSNGKLVDTKDNGDTRTFHWVMDQPFSNYLSSIVVMQTTPVEQKFDDVPVINYGYPDEAKEVALTTKNLPATIAFFSQITGVKYQYPKYSQAFVEDFGGGMENISATTQIEEMIHDERELLDGDSESLQSHELGHQWFGDYVTCRDWGQIWLNESFATYMQAMWDEKFKGHDEFLYQDVRANHDQVLGTWNSGNRRPIVTKYYADKDAMFDNYAYPGGGSVLHMLRKELGDKLFFASLHKYLTDNAHQPVSTEDLRIAFEETTGQSMDWFFDQWLYRMSHPVFEVTQNYDDASKKLTLNVKQTQKVDVANAYPQTDFFQGSVDVEVDNRVQRVWLKPQETNVFTFDSAARPRLVNFDYESTWLKELKFDKSTDELLYQIANDKDVLARRWAMGELQKRGSAGTDRDRILAALSTASEKDTFWRDRRAAFSLVSAIVSPDPPQGQPRAAIKLDAATEALAIRLTKDPQSLIRADAIRLLGETQDAKYVSTYLAAVDDRSYGVIDEAARALALTKDTRAFDTLAKLSSTPSWKGRIMTAGLNGLATLGDKRSFDIGLRVASDALTPIRARITAYLLVGGAGKGDPRAYPVLASAFHAAYDTGNQQALFTLLRATTQLGDPRGQEVFDMMKTRYKDNAQILGFILQAEKTFQSAAKGGQ
ncbi:MAG: M1 family aminopeptidase [Pyrinomonadaceae bacterium]